MSAKNSQIQPFLFSIAKIVDGAVNGDYDKVMSYTTHLCTQLSDAGEVEASKRLLGIANKTKAGRSTAVSATSLAYSAISRPSLPVDNEFRLPMGSEAIYERGDVPLFLSEKAMEIVDQFVLYHREAGRFLSHGLAASSSLLLFGPPGCGKSQVAKHIAAELGLPIITSRADGVISSYLGSTAKNLRLLFDHFMSRPCILFLDELDSIGKMRDDEHELGELKRVVISLLQNIDALDNDHVLIAATNHEHLLDPAIWRRFTYKLALKEPDTTTRQKLLNEFLGRFRTDECVEIGALLSEGLTGSALRHLSENCIRRAILANETQVSLHDVIEGCGSALSSDPSSVAITDHEAIKLLRQSDPKKFTQNRLAELFGTSQSTVTRVLKGVKNA